MIKSIRLQVRPRANPTGSRPSSLRAGGRVFRAEGDTLDEVRLDAEQTLNIAGFIFRAFVIMPDGALLACVDGHVREALLEDALDVATPDEFELLLRLSEAKIEDVAEAIDCPVDDLAYRVREVVTKVQDRVGWDSCMCPESLARKTLSDVEADHLLNELLELPLFRLTARDLTPAKCAARARARQALLVEKGYLSADDVEQDYDHGPPPRSAAELLH